VLGSSDGGATYHLDDTNLARMVDRICAGLNLKKHGTRIDALYVFTYCSRPCSEMLCALMVKIAYGYSVGVCKNRLSTGPGTVSVFFFFGFNRNIQIAIVL
jgi:hypothetical protein